VYRDVVDIEDFPREFLRQLQEFFRTYNRQMGKRFKPAGILGAKAAWRAIATAQR
jgi:inorganic pyrophosphatase